jgi:anti-sigma factor RsiW
MTDDRPIGEDDLQALVDSRLPPERRAAVEAYLEANPDVAAQIASEREQREALRERLSAKAKEPVPSRLRVATLVAERRRRRARRLAALAASLAWLAVGGLAGWTANEWARRDAAASRPGSVAGEALAAHRTFAVEVAHPVEVSAAQEQHLVQWLSRRLGRPLLAPDLNGHGFRLMGGRLLPSDAGPAAQFMYENAPGTRVTLYVQAGASAETAFRFAQEGDIRAFFWVDDGLSYAIASALEREGLLAIAEAVHRQLESRRPDRKRTAL